MPSFRNKHNGEVVTIEGVEANVLAEAENWELLPSSEPPQPEPAEADKPAPASKRPAAKKKR